MCRAVQEFERINEPLAQPKRSRLLSASAKLAYGSGGYGTKPKACIERNLNLTAALSAQGLVTLSALSEAMMSVMLASESYVRYCSSSSSNEA
jgi:hypothetical protein